jgi:SAM-dependent methyltransferase
MLSGEKSMTSSTDVSVIDVYQRHGMAWARLRSDNLLEKLWLDRFCALLPAGAAILDIGCGSGLPIARELIRRGFDITGVDGTPTMLAQFQRNLPGVAAHLADMRDLALKQRFAGLLAWDSFFHLSPSDQRAMIPRFQAHAAPGAALMFTSGDAEGEAMGELEGDPLYHGSLDPEEYRSLLAAAGFAVIAHTVKDPACGHRTVWLAQQGG